METTWELFMWSWKESIVSTWTVRVVLIVPLTSWLEWCKWLKAMYCTRYSYPCWYLPFLVLYLLCSKYWTVVLINKSQVYRKLNLVSSINMLEYHGDWQVSDVWKTKQWIAVTLRCSDHKILNLMWLKVSSWEDLIGYVCHFNPFPSRKPYKHFHPIFLFQLLTNILM